MNIGAELRISLKKYITVLLRHLVLTSVLLSGVFSGCFEYYAVITINPDGTGTITEKVLFSPETAMMINDFSQLDDNKTENSVLYSEDYLKKRESDYGETVVFSGVNEVKQDSLTGYEVVYKFQDISKVRLKINPEKALPGVEEGENKMEDEQVLSFTFEKNKLSTVEIKMGNQLFNRKDKLKEISGINSSDTMEQNLIQVLSPLMGFKMDYRVAINGIIDESDYRNIHQNEIPIMSIDLSKFLNNVGNVKEFSEKLLLASTPEEVFEGIEGININFQQKIRITFH